MDESGDLTGQWRFAQCFGDKGDVEDITEADIISAVEFDHTGDYLATGDKGGRVVLFERNHSKKGCEYKFFTEFQSHEPEFDYLKSLEIEEKINKIRWCRRTNRAHFLLSTNDKTIKLWKLYEKNLKVVAENNLSDEFRHPRPLLKPFTLPMQLKLPRLSHHDTIVAAYPRRVYSNAHAYHINSISVNSDAETYISADDLRINLWNLGISDHSFNIVDIKPDNMEELTEVITSADFHPINCNHLMYSSSKGNIKLLDLRQSALCDNHTKLFEDQGDQDSKSFFSEIISSISDIKFSQDGRYILSRDYLSLKIWDINMEKMPVKTIPLHDVLRSKLCDLYENDCIFDKFECTFSGDGKHALSGSYSNNFGIYPTDSSKHGDEGQVVLQADKAAFRARKSAASSTVKLNSMKGNDWDSRSPAPMGSASIGLDPDQLDYNKKILHASWHPFEDSVAIAATNNLFVFSKL